MPTQPSFTHIETLAVHAGHQIDPGSGAVTTPIHVSTTFERSADGSYAAGYVYSRSDNPNRQGLEACLAALEGGSGGTGLFFWHGGDDGYLPSIGDG